VEDRPERRDDDVCVRRRRAVGRLGNRSHAAAWVERECSWRSVMIPLLCGQGNNRNGKGGPPAQMISPNYQTIFQIGLRSFPWTQLLHPIPFIVIALVLLRFSRGKQIYKIVGTVVALLGALFLLISVLVFVPDFVKQRGVYVNGGSSVVEGTIQDFHPAPVLGPANESFTVQGIPFSYNVLDATPCFHNAPPHKGPIRPGLVVRIYYRDGCIQRLDVRQ